MKPIKFNADYERVLFHNQKGPDSLCHALEFLALYVEDRPLCSTKKYSPIYLEHIAKFTGRIPQITCSSFYENWWGGLREISTEKKLNSKITSTELVLKQGWDSATKIVSSPSELAALFQGTMYLAKSPFGMSGQNIIKFTSDNLSKVIDLLKKITPIIITPFKKRLFDFSHYVFPDGSMICYENLVDEKFQYRGSLFQSINDPKLESLRFFARLEPQKWHKFTEDLKIIINYYNSLGATEGFSIDSFIYEEKGELKIESLCEVNYRKTMGLLSFLIGKKLRPDHSWCLFLMVGSGNEKRKVDHPAAIRLSPEDSKFDIYLLSAQTIEEGNKILWKIKDLLPRGQFSVEF